jgi:hypothetical protein
MVTVNPRCAEAATLGYRMQLPFGVKVWRVCLASLARYNSGMALARYRTDYRIWALIAVCAFVALGFVDPVAGVAKGHNSLWSYLGILLRGEYYCSTSELVAATMSKAVLAAAPAFVAGWVAQALIVVIWRSLKKPSRSAIETPVPQP